MKFISDKDGTTLAGFGYPVGIIFTDDKDANICEIKPKVYTGDELEEELTYRLKTGYDNYRFFLEDSVYELAAMRVTCPTYAGPVIKYYMDETDITNLLADIDKLKQFHTIDYGQVKNGILFLKVSPK